MLIEILASGPDQPFLKQCADGWTWRLLWYRTEPPEPQVTYRVDVVDEKGTFLIYSEEEQQNTHDEALDWAENTFLNVLDAYKKLPGLGLVLGEGFEEQRERFLEKYRRK